ncbi:hypothetical protein CLHOM_00460 [Clostridium homopropionicum DSM 5847]|uniref:Uncharacterized protein n=1 Tax=Clostridium homopropionicum DSM 5847 TaxID=1121318 RepID=A0A0L6ZEH3_9CLOT|nr:hypothetical protein [Clostridium homopropionicum]KOA21375.1 hypothetical protein CLHOM_00460 [Clostridium homopropionicum DSM 5847]SFG11927.1 hypothetical protein SAMN04488501_105180 [Clostridium homopropionicum]
MVKTFDNKTTKEVIEEVKNEKGNNSLKRGVSYMERYRRSKLKCTGSANAFAEGDTFSQSETELNKDSAAAFARAQGSEFALSASLSILKCKCEKKHCCDDWCF